MRRWIIAAALAGGSAIRCECAGFGAARQGRAAASRCAVLAHSQPGVRGEPREGGRCSSTGSCAARPSSRNALLPADDPQAKRVQRIAQDLLPHTHKWNTRAKDWKWEVILVKSPTVNALCMPGGKIAIFTGILDALKLTDDELAVVLGHEMAHALREHARARAAKITLTNVGALAIGLVIGGNVGELARQGGGLLTLKFNRDDERDADLIGMELAARAGYDPEAGITLWEKMGQCGECAPALAVDASLGADRIGACGRRSRTSPGSTRRPRRTVRP